jgi:cytochrome b subunit of formate dehydrogenase
MKRHAAYNRAQSTWNSFAILPIMTAVLWGVFMTLIGFGIIPIASTGISGMVLNPAFAGLAALLSTLFVYTMFYVAACNIRLAMLAMEQAEEHHRLTNDALARTLGEIRRELRRRPDSSSPVTFSLFGRSNAAAGVVPVEFGDTASE